VHRLRHPLGNLQRDRTSIGVPLAVTLPRHDASMSNRSLNCCSYDIENSSQIRGY
jgi:hypothetical protein